VCAVRYRLVLFDFDGTLADSFPFFIEIFNDVAGPMGIRRLEPADVERSRSLGPREVMRELGVSWWKLPVLARRMRRRMASDTARVRLFTGVPEMLQRLSDGGLTLGVVTSNAEDNVRAILGPSAELIRHWKCEASMFGKAARFRALLSETRLAPRDVVSVGDEVRDAEAARRAGIDFAAATWGYAARDALVAARPALLFEGVEEIAARLLDGG